MIKLTSETKYLRQRRPKLLYEILQLIEGVKPGVYLEQDYAPDKKLIDVIKKLSQTHKLIYKPEHGGYVTRNQRLSNEWSNSQDPIKEEPDQFIGYPKCCSKTLNITLNKMPLIRELYTYYLVTKKDLTRYLKNTSYASHYPCNIECEETKKITDKTKRIMEKYKHILPKNFEQRLHNERLRSLRSRVKNIIELLKNDEFNKQLISHEEALNKIKEQGLNKLMSLNKEFNETIKELFKPDNETIKRLKKIEKEYQPKTHQ